MQKEIQQLKDKHEQPNSLDVTKAAEWSFATGDSGDPQTHPEQNLQETTTV